MAQDARRGIGPKTGLGDFPGVDGGAVDGTHKKLFHLNQLML